METSLWPIKMTVRTCRSLALRNCEIMLGMSDMRHANHEPLGQVWKGSISPHKQALLDQTFHSTLIVTYMVLPVMNEKQATGASVHVLASGAAQTEPRSSIMCAQQGTANVMRLLRSDGCCCRLAHLSVGAEIPDHCLSPRQRSLCLEMGPLACCCQVC